MNKVADNKLSSLKSFFEKELNPILGERETHLYFEACAREWLGFSKADLIISKQVHLTESQILRFLYSIKDFKNNVPLAHVIGKTFFFGLELKVTPDTLIPRPETEELVALVVEKIPKAKSILDIGTGSGCIALALKKSIPEARVTAIDVSRNALEVARLNAKNLNLDLSFFEEDILSPNSAMELDSLYDVIVSNPPYIPLNEKSAMKANVVGKDPDLALFVSDEDPLLFYEKIGLFAKTHLSDNGKLFFEINESYGSDVVKVLNDLGFSKAHIVKDLQAKDRMIIAQI